MAASQRERILALAHTMGVLRPHDLVAHGLRSDCLRSLVEKGALERVGRGLHAAADAEWTAGHNLAEVSKRKPKAVVCLLSALSFHGLTTQAPADVWLAVARGARTSRLPRPAVRWVRMSRPSLAAGVETHNGDGVQVLVTSPAKAVVDCVSSAIPWVSTSRWKRCWMRGGKARRPTMTCGGPPRCAG
jgi:predicted transcriptional regulator of viral defense system